MSQGGARMTDDTKQNKTKSQVPALSKEKNTESCKLPFSVTENGSQAQPYDYG